MAAMRRLAPHVRLATWMRISNVWLFEDGAGRRLLVDTGHPLERGTLRASLWAAGVRGRGDLDAVLLTHRHSDHAGNAAWLRERFGCAVVAHEADARVLRGEEPPPRLSRGVARLHEEVLCRIEDRFPARCEVDEAIGEGPWKWGLRAVHVPGHTRGSILLLHEPTATLFSGDALLSGIPPLRLWEWPRLAVHGFSDAVEECHDRVLAFLREAPRIETVCAGHGPILRSGVREKLARLVARRAATLPRPGRAGSA